MARWELDEWIEGISGGGATFCFDLALFAEEEEATEAALAFDFVGTLRAAEAIVGAVRREDVPAMEVGGAILLLRELMDVAADGLADEGVPAAPAAVLRVDF